MVFVLKAPMRSAYHPGRTRPKKDPAFMIVEAEAFAEALSPRIGTDVSDGDKECELHQEDRDCGVQEWFLFEDLGVRVNAGVFLRWQS